MKIGTRFDRVPFFLPSQAASDVSVAAAAIVASAGIAAVAAAVVGTHEDDNDQKNDPAVITEKVHRIPSLPFFSIPYYAENGDRFMSK